MKHLKLYESSEYYSMIEYPEYLKHKSESLILKKSEFKVLMEFYNNKIKKMIPKNRSCRYNSSEIYLSNYDSSKGLCYIIRIKGEHISKAASFYKINDEWFYVYVSDNYSTNNYMRECYKCDQLSGLLSLLEDIIVSEII